MAIHREVPVGRSGLVALVDEEDYELVAQYRWYHHASGGYDYARRYFDYHGTSRKGQFMHGLILGTAGVDHINHDGLDNRRANIRVASHAQNAANRRLRSDSSFRYRGIRQIASGNWQAMARGHYLGIFASAEQAARAYDDAAIDIYGEFANLNFGKS